MQNGELQKVLKKVEALFKHQFAQTIELKSSETAAVTEKERGRKAQERERRREREEEERKASGGNERVNKALLQLANKSIVSPTRCQQYSPHVPTPPATPFTPSSYFLQWFTNC